VLIILTPPVPARHSSNQLSDQTPTEKLVQILTKSASHYSCCEKTISQFSLHQNYRKRSRMEYISDLGEEIRKGHARSRVPPFSVLMRKEMVLIECPVNSCASFCYFQSFPASAPVDLPFWCVSCRDSCGPPPIVFAFLH